MSNATEFPSGPIIEAAAPSTAAYYLRAALEWIDAIPADVANALPAMPGFDRDEAESAAQKSGCACQACRPLDPFNMHMILCGTCGNKRCPHATDHRNECARSNEPGQPGSSYQNVGAVEVVGRQTFQSRVLPWLMECFGAEISADRSERNHRFFEEATELVQSCGMTASEAHQLVDYVYGRPVGERFQEVGGTMVTLAALCLANELNMHAAGEAELARISEPATVVKIRAKQAAKPKHSPLPQTATVALTNGKIMAVIDVIRSKCEVHLTPWIVREVLLAASSVTAIRNGADAALAEEVHVAKRMSETLAEVYLTILGDDAPDAEGDVIDKVLKAAQVLRMEVDLHRAAASSTTETGSTA